MSLSKETLVKLGAAFAVAGAVGFALTTSKNKQTAVQPRALCEQVDCTKIGEALTDNFLAEPFVEFAKHYGPRLRDEGRRVIEEHQKQKSPSP